MGIATFLLKHLTEKGSWTLNLDSTNYEDANDEGTRRA